MTISRLVRSQEDSTDDPRIRHPVQKGVNGHDRTALQRRLTRTPPRSVSASQPWSSRTIPAAEGLSAAAVQGHDMADRILMVTLETAMSLMGSSKADATIAYPTRRHDVAPALCRLAARRRRHRVRRTREGTPAPRPIVRVKPGAPPTRRPRASTRPRWPVDAKHPSKTANVFLRLPL